MSSSSTKAPLSGKPLDEAIPSVTEQECANLQGMFQQLDGNHDGYLSRRDIGEFVRTATGSHPSTGKVTSVVRDFDEDNDGRVSFDDLKYHYEGMKEAGARKALDEAPAVNELGKLVVETAEQPAQGGSGSTSSSDSRG